MIISSGDELVRKRCVPCEGGIDPVDVDEARAQLEELPGWELVDEGKRIRRRLQALSFLNALAFFQKIAAIAEQEGHHPDLHLVAYREVTIELWTHAIDGLSENDFILAAKLSRLDFVDD